MERMIRNYFVIDLPQKEKCGDTIRVGWRICKVVARFGNKHLLKAIHFTFNE